MIGTLIFGIGTLISGAGTLISGVVTLISRVGTLRLNSNFADLDGYVGNAWDVGRNRNGAVSGIVDLFGSGGVIVSVGLAGSGDGDCN